MSEDNIKNKIKEIDYILVNLLDHDEIMKLKTKKIVYETYLELSKLDVLQNRQFDIIVTNTILDNKEIAINIPEKEYLKLLKKENVLETLKTKLVDRISSITTTKEESLEDQNILKLIDDLMEDNNV